LARKKIIKEIVLDFLETRVGTEITIHNMQSIIEFAFERDGELHMTDCCAALFRKGKQVQKQQKGKEQGFVIERIMGMESAEYHYRVVLLNTNLLSEAI
jgi:hypothetical protein